MENLIAQLKNTRDYENLNDRVGEEMGNLIKQIVDGKEQAILLDLADAQMLGFDHARKGFNIQDLASSMGLTEKDPFLLTPLKMLNPVY